MYNTTLLFFQSFIAGSQVNPRFEDRLGPPRHAGDQGNGERNRGENVFLSI